MSGVHKGVIRRRVFKEEEEEKTKRMDGEHGGGRGGEEMLQFGNERKQEARERWNLTRKSWSNASVSERKREGEVKLRGSS